VRGRGSDADGGLCQIIGTGMRCYGKADGLPGAGVAESLAEDTLGNLWIGSNSTVVRWKPGSSNAHTWGLKKIEESNGVMGLAANPDGSVWVGIAQTGPGLGLQQLVQGDWKSFVTPELDGSTLEVYGCSGTAKTLCGSGRATKAFTAFLVARWSIFMMVFRATWC
jgi:ligand-binding sensor domain-containing protein